MTMTVAGSKDTNDQQGSIRALFDDWNNALQTQNPAEVVTLYAADAILLPTVSNKVRRTPAEIEDYFIDFLARGPSGAINESDVRTFGDIAIHSGIYTFSFSDASRVQARFTFVYHWNGTLWQIIEHHSSKMPETSV
ncbi:MAG: SgcJ/EcaC family oxidoreductase [Halioglobus sp.]|nr:SgcJ/EcaC family oxidoreductase [Halioglobus sp.]